MLFRSNTCRPTFSSLLIPRNLGLIREKTWFGPDGMEHLKTVKEPKQPIPTFEQAMALIMKVKQAELF